MGIFLQFPKLHREKAFNCRCCGSNRKLEIVITISALVVEAGPINDLRPPNSSVHLENASVEKLIRPKWQEEANRLDNLVEKESNVSEV